MIEELEPSPSRSYILIVRNLRKLPRSKKLVRILIPPVGYTNSVYGARLYYLEHSSEEGDRIVGCVSHEVYNALMSGVPADYPRDRLNMEILAKREELENIEEAIGDLRNIEEAIGDLRNIRKLLDEWTKQQPEQYSSYDAVVAAIIGKLESKSAELEFIKEALKTLKENLKEK